MGEIRDIDSTKTWQYLYLYLFVFANRLFQTGLLLMLKEFFFK